jgi:hypothetical protein
VTEPQEALRQARANAEQMRAQGEYADDLSGYSIAPGEVLNTEKLLEWALIEPDIRDVRSTRRAGAPITMLKQGLLRLLRQYHGELIAEQTRFNINLVVYLRRLENRIEELESRLDSEQ